MIAMLWLIVFALVCFAGWTFVMLMKVLDRLDDVEDDIDEIDSLVEMDERHGGSD